ncbi:hypothetical protein QZH56_36715 [Streptomyces olivoreticuli]|nr:hypothetical protein [Streptomyces olivoreticuli]WKK24121.1 hypothetical protein QZH56_36715 [Streptomyces olivoreticuli]
MSTEPNWQELAARATTAPTTVFSMPSRAAVRPRRRNQASELP